VEEEYNMAIFKQIKNKSMCVIPLLLANCKIPGFLQEKILLTSGIEAKTNIKQA
jgi:hypothetical protein